MIGRTALALMALVAMDMVGASWPQIRAVTVKRSFSPDGAHDTALEQVIRGERGEALYKLECHNGEYEDSSIINFSGDFQCVLYSVTGGRRSSWNLLATQEPSEQKSDFNNRGRMTANQLWGDCGAKPEYGTIRHFHLRGMSITFRFKDLRWFSDADGRQPRLKTFTFEAKVSPDKDAKTPSAAKVQTSAPGPPCR